MLFNPGSLLRSERYPDYYLFVQAVNNGKYHVWHVIRWETEKVLAITKNAGHDCWVEVEQIETGKYMYNGVVSDSMGYGKFTKVGHIPALLNQASVRITK